MISCFSTTTQVKSQELCNSTISEVIVDIKKSTEYSKELEYLALTIYGEARGETDADMYKVGSVILNRVKSPKYPSTIEEVVLQPNQFYVWSRSNPNYSKMVAIHALDRTSQDWKAYRRARQIAAELMESGPRIKALSFRSVGGSHIYK